jgi:tungstate transport system substrate-binding protein
MLKSWELFMQSRLDSPSRRLALQWLGGSAMLFGSTSRGAAQSEPKPERVWGEGPLQFKVATGSPGELGLLEVLAKQFAASEGATVIWYKAGSGQAMDLLKARMVDLVLAHAPAAEKAAVAVGWATGRRVIGSNEFWIVGPTGDPAGLAAASDASDAFKRMLAGRVKFVTRADNSGTHQKEMEIWMAAGIAPSGDWYIPNKDFMAASLKRADKEQAYFLTDSSTFIAERKNLPGLALAYRGGPMLLNPYHTLWLTDPTPSQLVAIRFAKFLYGAETQAQLRTFGRDTFGEAMYIDAATTLQRMNSGT